MRKIVDFIYSYFTLISLLCTLLVLIIYSALFIVLVNKFNLEPNVYSKENALVWLQILGGLLASFFGVFFGMSLNEALKTLERDKQYKFYYRNLLVEGVWNYRHVHELRSYLNKREEIRISELKTLINSCKENIYNGLFGQSLSIGGIPKNLLTVLQTVTKVLPT